MLREGIREAIAIIQAGRVPALAEPGEGVGGEFREGAVDRHDFYAALTQPGFELGSSTKATFGDDRCFQAVPGRHHGAVRRPERGPEGGSLLLSQGDRDEDGGVDDDQTGNPFSSYSISSSSGRGSMTGRRDQAS